MRGPGCLILLVCACGRPADDTGGAVATTTTPTYDTAPAGMSDDQTLWLSYSSTPDPIAPAEPFTLTFGVFEPDQQTPVTELTSLVVDATMPEHAHGMNVIPESTSNGDGTWSASPLEFHMTGHWEITATTVRDGVEDITRFHVDCCVY